MTCSFYGINGVKRVVRKTQMLQSDISIRAPEESDGAATYHEVVLDERDLIGKASLGCECGGSFNLVAIIVHANDFAASKCGNLSCWSTDTAAHVEYSIVVFDVNHVCKVMLMASQCLHQ
jgi:hypothetical protein